MTATRRKRVEGRYVEADVPGQWIVPSVDTDEQDVDLVVLGPPTYAGRRPRLVVRVQLDTEASIPAPRQESSVWNRVLNALTRTHPDTLLASQESWPHPVWGDGTLLQTARLDDGAALAHDCYVFSDHGLLVRVDVECALADLLLIEDEVADIVCRLKPRTPSRAAVQAALTGA